jgi:hypothetical protein
MHDHHCTFILCTLCKKKKAYNTTVINILNMKRQLYLYDSIWTEMETSQVIVYWHVYKIFVLVKLIVVQPIKKFPAFDTTRIFITVFTWARKWSLSWARWIQPTITPCFFKIHSNIILPSKPRSSKRSLPFQVSDSRFPGIRYSPVACCNTPPPPQFILLVLITNNTSWRVQGNFSLHVKFVHKNCVRTRRCTNVHDYTKAIKIN